MLARNFEPVGVAAFGVAVIALGTGLPSSGEGLPDEALWFIVPGALLTILGLGWGAVLVLRPRYLARRYREPVLPSGWTLQSGEHSIWAGYHRQAITLTRPQGELLARGNLRIRCNRAVIYAQYHHGLGQHLQKEGWEHEGGPAPVDSSGAVWLVVPEVGEGLRTYFEIELMSTEPLKIYRVDYTSN